MAIAKHLLGPSWIGRKREAFDETGKRYAELVRPDDGAQLGVYVGGYRQEGRVTFRAHWPKYRDGRPYTPRVYHSITCSAQRDPKALARDIERRLLAEYEPAYRQALDEIRASDVAAETVWHAAERIAHTLGAEMPRDQPNNGANVALYGGRANVYRLEVHPPYNDEPVRVSFQVGGLDEQAALEVLALIARHQARSS
jgi:hypothetical protein